MNQNRKPPIRICEAMHIRLKPDRRAFYEHAEVDREKAEQGDLYEAIKWALIVFGPCADGDSMDALWDTFLSPDNPLRPADGELAE